MAVLTLLAATTGCGAHGAADNGTHVIKFAMENSKTSSEYKMAARFGSVLSKLSNGKLTLQIYPSEQLGPASSEIQGVRAGTIQAIGTSNLDSVVKSVDVSLLPYMFTSMDEAQKVLNGTRMQQVLWSQFSQYDMKVVGTWPVGALGIMSTKSGTDSLASLKGQRIRVLAPLVVTPLLKAWGTNPTPVDAQQVLTSLSTGLVDGVFDPPDPITSQGWQQYGKTYIQTNSIFNNDTVVFSQKFFNGLPANLQKDITTAFQQTLGYANRLIASQTSAALTTMKNAGIQVYTPDPGPFRQASATAEATWDSEFGAGLIAKVRAVAKAAQ